MNSDIIPIQFLEPQIGQEFAKIVYVNAISPNTATIFDENTSPTTNDTSLKDNSSYLYIGNDGSTWV